MEHDREDIIRQDAYRRWEAEGRPDGDHDRHWREAEDDYLRRAQGIAPSADDDALPAADGAIGSFASENK